MIDISRLGGTTPRHPVESVATGGVVIDKQKPCEERGLGRSHIEQHLVEQHDRESSQC
jgi:hypothetical protein